MGSEDLLVEVASANVVDGLKPILDTNGVFSDPTTDVHDSNTFLGWSNEAGDLQVFGLSAENTGTLGHNGKRQRVALNDPTVLALKNWLSGDVLTVGQLAYIRSALRAVNNYVPGSIEHRVDSSHADANQLRIHLAAKYPNLAENCAREFICLIRRFRAVTNLQERLPHGFTAEQGVYLESALTRMANREIKSVILRRETGTTPWVLN